MAKYGTLFEPGDILPAGAIRIISAGRYEKAPEGAVAKDLEPVQVAGGIVTHGHDGFFFEQDLNESPIVQKLRDEILSLGDKYQLLQLQTEIKDKHINMIPPLPRSKEVGTKRYILKWEEIPQEVGISAEEAQQLADAGNQSSPETAVP